jgi:serine/threonine protein kinase
MTTEALVGGRYAIVRRLAQGGMGDVLLAEFRGDQQLGLTPGLVVVKRVLPDHPNRANQARMLREEGRVGQRLLHENIVETFLIDEHNGDPLLVMEFLSGRAMSQVLGQAKKRKEAVPIEVALSILRSAACGLHFAHTLTDRGRPLGLVHRDVSPANIFVTFDGRVKVIDFGVAKADDSEIRTSTGILKGKLGYMSPEHALGEKLTPAADLWSLGVCFWETLCAERLFASSSPSATLQAISERPVPSPRLHRPDLPAHVEALCMGLLERELHRRIATGKRLVEAIDKLPEAAALPRLDLGGWLSGRFPEEAGAGRGEAARAARLRRRQPVPIGLVEGTAVAAPSESDAPTLVIGAAQALEAKDLLAQDGIDVDVATVRMKLSDIPIDPVDVSAEDAPTARITPSLLVDKDSDKLASPEARTQVTPTDGRAEFPEPPPTVREPSGAQPRPREPSGAHARAPGPTTGSLSPSTSSPVAPSATATLPLQTRASSWVGVAFLTFGALALAMGVAFSFLTPRPTPHYVAAIAGAGGEVFVAPADAPSGARTVDVTRPDAKVNGALVPLEPSALGARLESSGVRLRASLPSTPRATLAALLPVLIAGLGLLALAGALPTVIFSSSRRLAGQAGFLAVAVAVVGFAVKAGALSWPGVDAWKRAARLEMTPELVKELSAQK